jgi:hypothetical protein
MSYLAFEKRKRLKGINPEMEFIKMCQVWKCRSSGVKSQEQRFTGKKIVL